MGGRAAWQSRWPRGRFADHPAVALEASGSDPGTRPVVRRREGLVIVTYRRPRVYLDRDAWEMLPDDGVLLMRVQPASGAWFALAMAPDELADVFGSVRATKSWDTARCYHFAKIPRAASAFRVPGANSTSLDMTDVPDVSPGSVEHAPVPPGRSSRLIPGPTEEPDGSASLANWARSWFSTLGVGGESDEYLAAVAAWRQAWRPERVRVLLVAESHVAQIDGDSDVRVRAPSWVKRDLPSSYVRLVYCLGYGESTLCSPWPAGNGGTWQFWNLLGQVGLGTWARLPRASAGPTARLRWKADVLEGLAKRGVWLQDASPIGLYQPGGQRPVDGSRYETLLREGYERFVWPSVEHDQPEQVWVIGRGVGKALSGLPGIDPNRVISQPQDRNQSRYRAGLRTMLATLHEPGNNPRP